MSSALYQALLKSANSVYSKKINSNFDNTTTITSKSKNKLDTVPHLEPFITGGLGNFPYYWKDPRTNQFNIETYNWINANVKAGAYPIEQASGSNFTNLTITALGSVYYTLSTSDQMALVKDSLKIFNLQTELLNAWAKAYGSIPPATASEEPIDIIISIIATTWASPSTTFEQMQNTADLNLLLNVVPPSGKPVMPILMNYINGLNASSSLQSSFSTQSGYLNAAFDALQNPTLANGALKTNNSLVLPAYVVSTPLAEILAGLKSTANSFRLSMKISQIRKNKFLIEYPDKAIHVNSLDSLLLIPDVYEQNIIKSLFEKNSGPINIELEFSGLTMVYFQPETFEQSIDKYWFWKEPIIEALQNVGKDITGFQFSPFPLIDFSKKGPYGFITAVGISNFPIIYITQSSNAGDKISDSFSEFKGKVNLLGKVLEDGESSNRYSLQTIENSDQSEKIVLCPETDSVPGINSRAWVHGVLVDYPVAEE